MLYPVKVDVSSKDGIARIVDSILIDPTCLPIPTSPILSIDSTGDNLLNETINQNSKYFAKRRLDEEHSEANFQVFVFFKRIKSRVFL